MDGWPWARGRSRLGGALVGVIASGVSTGVALLVHPSPALGVVAIYLLGVVGAARDRPCRRRRRRLPAVVPVVELLARLIKRPLLFEPNVVVTSVPFHPRSATA